MDRITNGDGGAEIMQRRPRFMPGPARSVCRWRGWVASLKKKIEATVTIRPICVSRSAPRRRPTSFQVFGERRSGTNYLAALLHRNTGLKPLFNFGWKHGFPVMPVLPRETLFVGIVREPMDWVQAFYRSPYEAADDLLDLGFSDFIRAEWKAVFRPYAQQWAKWGYGGRIVGARRGQELQLDRHPVEGRRFRNILEMRSLKLQGHLSLARRGLNAIFFRYEDLREDPAACLDIITATFDIKRHVDFNPIQNVVSPNMFKPGRSDAAVMSDEDRAFVVSQLMLPQERFCGYLQDRATVRRLVDVAAKVPAPPIGANLPTFSSVRAAS